jgi:hypothetical protein
MNRQRRQLDKRAVTVSGDYGQHSEGLRGMSPVWADHVLRSAAKRRSLRFRSLNVAATVAFFAFGAFISISLDRLRTASCSVLTRSFESSTTPARTGSQRELHDIFGLPWDLIAGLSAAGSKLLLHRLRSLQQQRELDLDMPLSIIFRSSATQPRILVVHAMHGLGNRLRAVASAMAFAFATKRQLIIVWERDTHCNASFGDLFENSLIPMSQSSASENHLIIVDELPLLWSEFGESRRHDVVWRDWTTYNYMKMEGRGAIKDQKMVDQPDKHMYWKSAYVMAPADDALTGWDLANVQLRRLTPIAAVKDLVAVAYPSSIERANVVGVHIRSMTLVQETGIDAISEYGQDDADILAYWRNQSSPLRFFGEMQRLVENDPTTQFFLASDSSNVSKDAKRLFSSRLHMNNPPAGLCDSDRGSACLQFALSDMLALARTRIILGSPWSSFTEGAQRFGTSLARTAGIDFGLQKETSHGHLPPAVKAMLERSEAKWLTRKGKQVKMQGDPNCKHKYPSTLRTRTVAHNV